MLFTNQQIELSQQIDCSRCSARRSCDQIRQECPKVNFQTLLVDDVSILKQESNPSENEAQKPETDFTKITRKEFETHLYQNITRCRHKNKILSFYSSEQEAQALLLFFFSHDGRYYRALREKDMPDAVLERQMMNFLYPDNKSFHYAGWFCRFNRDDLMFYLYTPSEMEQPAGFRNSEMEVSTPAQAIEFINCY